MWKHAATGWLGSLAAHSVALSALAGITLAVSARVEQPAPITVLAAEPDEPLVEFAEPEFEIASDADAAFIAVTNELPVPAATPPDFEPPSLSAAASRSIGAVMLDATTARIIGRELASPANRHPDLREVKDSDEFFGISTTGRRIAYLIDNSKSMQDGKFETATNELYRSIRRLSEDQEFFVIFFSDTAYPLFYPDVAEGPVAATRDNKRRLQRWLDTVPRCMWTRGAEAFDLAMSLQPNVIFLLGDGAFTDNTLDELLAIDKSSITVHTLRFSMGRTGRRAFRDIADHFDAQRFAATWFCAPGRCSGRLSKYKQAPGASRCRPRRKMRG